MQLTTLRKNGNSDIITVPRPYLKKLGWLKGMHLVLSIIEGHLVIQPLGNIKLPQLKVLGTRTVKDTDET